MTADLAGMSRRIRNIEMDIRNTSTFDATRYILVLIPVLGAGNAVVDLNAILHLALTITVLIAFTGYGVQELRKRSNRIDDQVEILSALIVEVDGLVSERKRRLRLLNGNISSSGSSTTLSPEHREPRASLLSDPSIPFEQGKAFPIEHRRLNMFAGTTSVSFDSVLSGLDPIKQMTYRRFAEQMSLVLDELDLDRTQFYQYPDEYTMLRFLQSDDYDIDLALARLSETVVWRQKFGLDRFIDAPNMKLYQRYRQLRVRRLVGMDKTGCPLVVERLGELIGSEESFRGGLTMEQWQLLYSYDATELTAALRECTDLTGKYTHRMNYVGDLSGASIRGAFRLIPVLKVMTKCVERNFPEFAGNLILVNAPSYAGTVWNASKRFLDKKTAAKIHILVGPSKEVLRKLCGEAVLPVEFGGTNPYVVPHLVSKLDDEFERKFPVS